LLRVYRRVAIRLMHRFGGYQAGRTFLIDRGLLSAAAREDRRRRSYFFETQRRIVIPAAPNVAYRELSGLPSTIRIGPGKLEVAWIVVHDLLRQFMELAQASGDTLV
jgi:hypothetical protein